MKPTGKSKIIKNDISLGIARHQIPAINFVDERTIFPEFDYSLLPTFGNMKLPDRQYCNCLDGCSDESGCACIVRSTVQLVKGRVCNVERVSENPFDTALFECTPDCACKGSCANKLAPPADQHKNQLEIVRYVTTGFTCRATKPIRKGSFVCFMAGEVLSPEMLRKETTKAVSPYNSPQHTCFNFQDENRQMSFCMRMDRFANESRFFNSACCPNMRILFVYRKWFSPDRPLIAFLALNEIEAREELTFYYGDHWILSKLIANSRFHCACRSLFCVWPQGHKPSQIEDAAIKHIRAQIDSRNKKIAKERHLVKKQKKVIRAEDDTSSLSQEAMDSESVADDK